MKIRGLLPGSALPWVALSLSVLLTLSGWQAAERSNREKIRLQFNKLVDDVDFAIRHRLLEYEQSLRSGAGLFQASREVTVNEWKIFVENIHLQTMYPGIQGMGFARQTLPAEREALTAAMRASGHRDFAIRPPGERPIYYPIIYLEPLDWRNQRAIGYDMFAEPVRRAAMTTCRDEGVVTISGKVELVQETEQGKQAGFLMYVPLYAHGAALETPEQRAASFQGFVYSPFRIGDFMAGASVGPDPWLHDGDLLELHIYDGAAVDPAQMMFDNRPGVPHLHDTLYRAKLLDLYQHQWTLETSPTPEFYARHDRGYGGRVLGGGLLVSLLVFMIAARLEMQKTGALERSGKMENALRESEERFDLAVRGAHMGTWDWEVPTGHVVFSDRLVEILGYRTGELENHMSAWEELIHPDDRPRVLREIAAHFEGRAGVYETEYRMRAKSGEWVWILDVGKVVTRDATGAPLRMAGASLNIDERKRAAEALAESEKNYRTIADFTNDWETWLAPNGWLRYVSPSCERITGYPPEKFIADPEFMMSIIHRDDRELYQRHLNDCHNAHTCCHGPDCGPEHLKFRIVRKDGAERWIEHICQSAFDGEGTWLGRRASNRDITDTVAAQDGDAPRPRTGGGGHQAKGQVRLPGGARSALAVDLHHRPAENRRQRRLRRRRSAPFQTSERHAAKRREHDHHY